MKNSSENISIGSKRKLGYLSARASILILGKSDNTSYRAHCKHSKPPIYAIPFSKKGGPNTQLYVSDRACLHLWNEIYLLEKKYKCERVKPCISHASLITDIMSCPSGISETSIKEGHGRKCSPHLMQHLLAVSEDKKLTAEDCSLHFSEMIYLCGLWSSYISLTHDLVHGCRCSCLDGLGRSFLMISWDIFALNDILPPKFFSKVREINMNWIKDDRSTTRGYLWLSTELL